jgi:NAD+ kinase
VSFIAPHTLTARPLVVSGKDVIEIEHMGRGVDLSIFADGVPVAQLDAGTHMRIGRGPGVARLIMLDERSFYARYRDCFAAQTLPLTAGRRVPRTEHSA